MREMEKMKSGASVSRGHGRMMPSASVRRIDLSLLPNRKICWSNVGTESISFRRTAGCSSTEEQTLRNGIHEKVRHRKMEGENKIFFKKKPFFF